ncbi:MAG: hypothetical protein JXP73_20565 [Deltaproteobacteria bacterium]|nr:hypothetical protein [Deltaproteobacteria bacterium]
MHMQTGVVLCIGLALWSEAAAADTYYKYRNKRTGRDVYVNSLDQVPRRYRDQAKIVLETEDKPSEAEEQPQEAVIETPPPPGRPSVRIAGPAGNLQSALRRALSGKNLLRDGPAVASDVVDVKLVSAGAKPLADGERAAFRTLLLALVIAGIATGLAATVVWIMMIVMAVRNDRIAWALLIFFLSPLAYVYLFLHAGKGRPLFKTLCALAMLSPALVGLVGAWRFHAWLQAIVQARGGHI